MKRLILVILTVFSIISCQDIRKPEKPKNLIPKNKMVDIIIDMSMLSATRGFDKKKLDSNSISVKSYIYGKYNIDSLQFAKSNEFYSYNIEEYEALYEKVDDSLKALKQKFQDIQDAELETRRKKDSLDKLSVPELKPVKNKAEKNLKLDSLKLFKKRD
ncbi:DUF4296 domain-containing protein [uncultured Formosa sp.]|uniref:DUF4296 domain-containing protein n=1 Tax=uncultured Formosa sp. TaxID=255435 RepID=UPI00262D1DCB|nr:DUF4296 domain-containing protein [uncultured Formosa sp.]